MELDKNLEEAIVALRDLWPAVKKAREAEAAAHETVAQASKNLDELQAVIASGKPLTEEQQAAFVAAYKQVKAGDLEKSRTRKQTNVAIGKLKQVCEAVEEAFIEAYIVAIMGDEV
jgi:hypothetical protein